MPGVKGQWTNEENYSLLFQMVQQLMGDGGKSVKYDQINIPGRTPRALKEHYAQMKNEVQAVDIQNQGSAGIPQVRATRGPGSGKKIKAEGKGTAKAATPSKRKSGDDGNNMSEFFLSFDMQQLTIFPHWIILLQISVASLQLRSSSADDVASASPQSYHSYDYYN
ncbi:hypothetical protein IFR04_015346 [Cadophora malorum]|uniref:Myb-like domain-containing protein n=1 Tax=Cadophora malorum TaxID=108018 RepID=A0A8H7W420_9HELO|nr:hypothetical protein IFR04_015346 [Cadophora malorum]